MNVNYMGADESDTTLTAEQKTNLFENLIQGVTDVSKSVIGAVSTKSAQEREFDQQMKLMQAKGPQAPVNWMPVLAIGLPVALIGASILFSKK